MAVIDRKGWQQYYFLGFKDLEHGSSANHEEYMYRGATGDSQIMICEESLIVLAKSIGGLIGVKAIGLPVGYDAVLHVTLFVFFVLVSVAWTEPIGWNAIAIIDTKNLVIFQFK